MAPLITLSNKLISDSDRPKNSANFLLSQVGLFDLKFKISSDYDFMLRFLLQDKLNVVYLPRVISKMRIGGESNKSLKNIITKSKEDYLIAKK